MFARTNAAFDESSRRRLAKVMAEGCEHHRNSLRIRQVIDQFTCSIYCQQRVNPNVTFRMPLRFLRYINQSLQLRKELIDNAEIAQPLQTDGRTLCAQEQLLDLAPDSFGGQISHIDCATKRNCLSIDIELKARGELRSAKNAQAVL